MQPVVVHEGRVQVNAIPLRYKLFVIVFALLPRTLIFASLASVGSDFLIGADDYQELILNSVALAFLIEIDNMMFTAVVSDDTKILMDDANPLKVELPTPDFLVNYMRTATTSALYTLIIAGMPTWMVTKAYHDRGGKYDVGQALRCLCHASGVNCITAQVLGGNPYLTGHEAVERSIVPKFW
eukprot:TRINITY_DN114905_c0_g1_i1.p1 TRINITY_DN114905_c0_g1~~TRINITY_DN114905_c0_g1_i1.p1  ORF type:complete len:183 (+),score=16.03 TRINITY_DN114905_c0_g1_i1:1-549(+)